MPCRLAGPELGGRQGVVIVPPLSRPPSGPEAGKRPQKQGPASLRALTPLLPYRIHLTSAPKTSNRTLGPIAGILADGSARKRPPGWGAANLLQANLPEPTRSALTCVIRGELANSLD